MLAVGLSFVRFVFALLALLSIPATRPIFSRLALGWNDAAAPGLTRPGPVGLMGRPVR